MATEPWLTAPLIKVYGIPIPQYWCTTENKWKPYDASVSLLGAELLSTKANQTLILEKLGNIEQKITALQEQADLYKEHRLTHHTDPKPVENIGINDTLVAMDTGDTWYWDGVEWKVILNG